MDAANLVGAAIGAVGLGGLISVMSFFALREAADLRRAKLDAVDAAMALLRLRTSARDEAPPERHPHLSFD
jgi:hypothetical protein